MVKRLIFDVDNTLIEWKNEYWETLKDVFKEENIEYNEILINNFIKAIDMYEKIYEYYNREKMLEHVNKITNSNFSMDFFNKLLKKFEDCIPPKDDNIYNVLEYLSKKYELVVLTNWFKDIQENRLKKFGIHQFFKEIFASENFKMKPNKESFDVAMGSKKPEECVMIGDNLETDIKGAINANIKAIYITTKLNKGKVNDYIVINKLEDLKELL